MLQSSAGDDTALDLRHLDVGVCTDGSFAFTLKAFTNGDNFGTWDGGRSRTRPAPSATRLRSSI